MKPRFSSSVIVATTGADLALAAADEDPRIFLARLFSGVWGDMPDEDKRTNDRSLVTKSMLMSSYSLKDGVIIWIITDPGHQTTTILLPQDY